MRADHLIFVGAMMLFVLPMQYFLHMVMGWSTGIEFFGYSNRFLIIVPIGWIFIGLGYPQFNYQIKTVKTKTGNPIPIEELTNRLALFIHSYTTKKDIRPLGLLALIGGIDETGPHLYVLDPSGTYRESSPGAKAPTATKQTPS